MWWAQSTEENPSDTSLSLHEIAVMFGADPAHAGEVVGAVHDFASIRHGPAFLSRDYKLFLLARSLSYPLRESRDDAWLPFVSDPVFFRALMHTDDAASLYEAHRRRLVWAGPSDAVTGGRAVHINLGKVKISAREQLELIWLPVFRRLADWACAWRIGDAAIRAVVISGSHGSRREWSRLRQLLKDTLDSREVSTALHPSELLWAG